MSSDRTDPVFAPEPALPMHTRSLYQSLRGNAVSLFEELRQRVRDIPEPWQEKARELFSLRETVLRMYRRILDEHIDCVRFRTHGDLQLARVLYTGKDFVLGDFMGDPRLTLSERRIKRRPLRDLASLLHSLDYAMRTPLAGMASSRSRPRGTIREADRPRAAAWGEEWRRRVQTATLKAYTERIGAEETGWQLSPRLTPLLHALTIDHALADVIEEHRTRPDWTGIALDCAVEAITRAPAEIPG